MEDKFKAALATELRIEMARDNVTGEALAAQCGYSTKTVSEARKGTAALEVYRKFAGALGVSFAAWVKRAEEDARTEGEK